MGIFRRKEYAILGVSALCGLFAFTALQPAPKPGVSVLVAPRTLNPNETFEDPTGMFEMVTWPADSLPPGGYLSSPDQLKGCAVKIAILKGEPIVEAKLAPDQVEAWVAVRDLVYEERFGEDDGAMVRRVLMPRGSLPPGCVTSFNDLKGRWVRLPFLEGELIIAEKLTSDPAASFNLPVGMRAVTIPADPISGASGFIQPGAHVDILLSRKGQIRSELILQDVLVLAVNKTTRPAPDKKAIYPPRRVLLAVQPSQAEILIGDEGRGSLILLLRNANDPLVLTKRLPRTPRINVIMGSIRRTIEFGPSALDQTDPAPTSPRVDTPPLVTVGH